MIFKVYLRDRRVVEVTDYPMAEMLMRQAFKEAPLYISQWEALSPFKKRCIVKMNGKEVGFIIKINDKHFANVEGQRLLEEF